MASYTYSIDAKETTITYQVTGLTAGDAVGLVMRYEEETELLYDIQLRADGPTLEYSHGIPSRGRSYVINVEVNAEWLGAKTFSTSPAPARPTDWSWSGVIYTGAPFENLTAAVWNQFTARINEFRTYTGDGAYGFTTAKSGVTEISAGVSEAMAAIRGLTGHGTLPPAVTIEASTFIQLAAALNAVT